MAKWAGFGARRASTFEDPVAYERQGLRFFKNMVHRSLIKTAPLLIASLFFGCGTDTPSTDPVKVPTTIAEVNALIVEDPRNPVNYGLRARIHEANDSLGAAVKDWNRAILLDSTTTKWRIALGDLYYRKVDLSNAEIQFIQAMRVAPDSNVARLKLAELRLLKAEFTEAMELTNDALRIDDQNARAYFLKGWIHRQAGDTALAISSYRTAVERDPNMYDAYVALGLLHAAKRDPLAMAYYHAATELRPASVEAWYARGIFAQETGKDSIALACYDRIKAIDPKNPTSWYNSGYVLLEHLDRIPEARAEFSQAIEVLPTYAAAYYNRGLTYELENNLDSALVDYKKALALQPDMDLAADGLGRLQARGLRVR
jgi:tetratricopeptide (TPR) repeat protein